MIRKQYKLSDHYNGKHFFNAALSNHELPGFFSALKMLWTTYKQRWPKSMANKATPQLDIPLNQNKIALTFVNHVTFLMQLHNMTLLTDPIWSDRPSPIAWLGPKRIRAPGIAISELPLIDLILISHNHYDHLDLPTLRKLKETSDPIIIVPLGNKQTIKKLGFTHVVELDWWESHQLSAKTKITFLPTQHFSSRSLCDRFKTLWGSFLIQHENSAIYFGGDAGYSNYYKEISQRMGSIDLALLGIGAYEPQWFMRQVHMNPKEALQAHLDLKAKQSIGMHYGTFQLSAEGLDTPINDLAQALRERNMPKKCFITLDEGETRVFDFSNLSEP